MIIYKPEYEWYSLEGRILSGQSKNEPLRKIAIVPPHIKTAFEASKWYEKGRIS